MRGRRWVGPLLLLLLLTPGLAMAARLAPPGPAAKPAVARPAARLAAARPSARRPHAASQVVAAGSVPPAGAWRASAPAPGRVPLPACPLLLEAIADGIQACRCAPDRIGRGAVLGAGPYPAGRRPAGRGSMGDRPERGGDLVIRVLPLPGEAPGGVRHGIAARPGRLDGRAYAVLPGLPGQLDWARRLAEALATPSPAPPRLPGRPEAPVPLPLPQAADLGGLLDARAGARAGPGRPGLGGLAPPMLMPALWRSPTRPADADAPPAEAPPRPPARRCRRRRRRSRSAARRRCWGRCG